eukprot:2962435-Prymnesium_polylepis.1
MCIRDSFDRAERVHLPQQHAHLALEVDERLETRGPLRVFVAVLELSKLQKPREVWVARVHVAVLLRPERMPRAEDVPRRVAQHRRARADGVGRVEAEATPIRLDLFHRLLGYCRHHAVARHVHRPAMPQLGDQLETHLHRLRRLRVEHGHGLLAVGIIRHGRRRRRHGALS